MKLAVVIPIYNEQENLPELSRRVADACDATGLDWQVIYVNDGSRDDSARIIQQQHKADSRFTMLSLSRNFGHQPAITAGLAHADADAVIIMDGDLQDPPELIPDLVRCWRDGGQVIQALRLSRQETGLRRLGFALFHRFFKLVSDYPIPANVGVFGLLDRRAVQQLQMLPESNRFFPGLRAWIGFDQRTVEYDRQERQGGKPKQTLTRLLRYAMDGVFSFSYKPLRLMMFIGLLVSTVGFILAAWFALRRLLGVEIAETGFTTLVVLVLCLGGLQLIALGLLGEYLGRTYDEVKRRPLYIVASRCGLGEADPSPARDAHAPAMVGAESTRTHDQEI